MQDEILYDTQVIGFLEEIWGDGFLSPGGPDEVARASCLLPHDEILREISDGTLG